MKLNLSSKSNLHQRILAGLVGAATIVLLIVLNEWTFFFLFAAICVIALQEFYKMMESSGLKPNRIYGTALGLFIFTIVFFIEYGLLHARTFYMIIPIFFLLFIMELFTKHDKPFHNIAFTFLGIIYIAFPLAMLSIPAFSTGTYNYGHILSVLLIIWATDTGAYIAGRAFGKNKLFERISPKKTWEGSIGGAILSVATALVLSTFFTTLSPLNWVFLALIIMVFGSFGDLVESLLKRSLDIKDSGALIPGHGGFLDRFDSLLIASPFIAAYFKILF
ncbi:phosphatidate cytidylyltransferase [Cytophagaceae bacterium ABcell3]|nr:phosphatidate cytidylyltransferase [Cytophagaceae bacterium ABcell3]